jgi:hypothetical protein
MKSVPKTGDQYAAFENLLRHVVQVPHSEIKAKLEQEKRTKKKKRPKTSDASRASSDKD